jgi:hypothetical protein
VHNFCGFNLNTKNGYCFLWNETEGGVTAEEFSSILVQLISTEIFAHGDKHNKKIIVYSDWCAAQNRNVTTANALTNLANIL